MFDLKTRVLIVDDMMTMRKLVSKSCKEIGFTELAEATDGALAWQKITEEGNFGLVISDWNMPNCTGLDLLKRVRADGRFSKMPFVMLTAEAEQHQVVDAMKAQVTGYIIKPFTTEILKGKLGEAYKKVVGG